MKLNSSKEFAFSMDTAWNVLHQPSRLDVEPGSVVKPLSDAQWEAHNADTGSVTTYTASFDDENKKVTPESISWQKLQEF